MSDEISQKLNDLEDAKAASTDMVSKRSYTKRFNKMNERVDHLEYVMRLRQHPEVSDKVEKFKKRIAEIDGYDSGKLI